MKLVFARPILCWSIFLAFFISLKFIPLYVGIPLKDLQNLFQGAMPSFGVICKAICHSIQNRLLYSPAKYQGWAKAWTRVISKFQWLFKMGNCFVYSLYVTFLCTDGVLKRLFVRLVKLIDKPMSLRRTFSLGFFAHYLLLLWWGGSLYRRALLSSLRLVIDSGLYFVSLVNLESVDVVFWWLIV